MSTPLPLPLPNHAAISDALRLYQELLPACFLEELYREAEVRQNNCVYTSQVVMWLCITQRLHGGASLQAAVFELLRGLPASFWPKPCKRVQNWLQHDKPVSSNPGAYNQARQQLSLTVVEQSCDRVFNELTARLAGVVPALDRRAFFFDGTSVRLAHSEELCKAYPPGSNQHGEAHWPLLRVLVAHDLETGLAMQPEWGPMHGPDAVSEQQLLEKALDHLPSGSVVVGDANFGVFSVAYVSAERGHPVLLRLTTARAQRLAGGPLEDGTNRLLVWKPSREDRRSHPHLPADACVRGRLIVRRVQPYNGAAPFLLALFTTLEIEVDEIVNLYGHRWYIETDLRSLKSTLNLDQLSCTTADMVAKEIDLGIAAYNLVRAVTCLAAERSGIRPREYSFTRVRGAIEAFVPLIANAKTEQEARKYFDLLMYCVGQAKLPKRRKKRSAYPRAVWNKGASFPNRQG